MSDEVAGQLQEQISLGKYQKGDRLPTEPELMHYFEVSRSTIREAIKVLANSGWVRVQQGLGTFVESDRPDPETLEQRFSRVDVAHLEEVRMLLERKILEKAAVNRTAAQLAQMKGYLEERKQFAEAGNEKKCIEVDIAFHTCVAQASGNPILADLYRVFAVRLEESFLLRYNTSDNFKITQRLHEQLLDSLERRDSAEAFRLIEQITSY